MSALSKQPAVQLPENQGSGDGTRDIGDPIAGVIANPSGDMALVDFVQPADGAHDHEDQKEARQPARPLRGQPDKKSGQQSAASEKVTEMGDLIEARNRRKACFIAAARRKEP